MGRGVEMKEELTDKKIDVILAGLDPLKLGKWESEFLASVKEWWGKRRKLSDKQKQRLGEMWEKANAKSS